jgi:hypothetical protein
LSFNEGLERLGTMPLRLSLYFSGTCAPNLCVK